MPTEDKLWLPPLSPKGERQLNRLQNHRVKAFLKRTGLADKTLWEWLQLLIVPLILAGGGLWFSYQQTQTSLRISEQQHQTDLGISKQQHQADLQAATD